jgi:RHH-type proline utilization regulon transcriptional repressor/proline dehydrogenase/delta 1-pyrroline-5-carboxylate dehydrogenase
LDRAAIRYKTCVSWFGFDDRVIDAPPSPPVHASSPPVLDDAALAAEAVELARSLLARSLAGAARGERRRQARMGRMLADPGARELIFALTDEVLRVDDPALAARRFAAIVAAHPTTAVGVLDRLLLRSGAVVAPLLPRLVMPLVSRRVKAETRGIVLSSADPAFADHVRTRRAQGVRLNVNPLGEAILSDAEAAARMRLVCERIDRPDVDHVSVKISSVVADLDAFAFDASVDRVCERLVELYRRAQAADPVTFVNLDMEEYRDLEMTLQAFVRVLSLPEFAAIDAGIVLQAYLPDSHDALERLGAWATARHAAGGGRVRVRLVKGANLAMERVEAELHGWVAAPYATKAEVDASFKAMLDRALRPEWADARAHRGGEPQPVRRRVGAAARPRRRGARPGGVRDARGHGARAGARRAGRGARDVLMYAPVVADTDFDASIAYLSRRLDENTQPDNFLRALFDLTPDSAEFDAQAERFRRSVAARHTVVTSRRRVRSVGRRRRPTGSRTSRTAIPPTPRTGPS